MHYFCWLICCLHSTGGQSCIDDVDNVQQSGNQGIVHNRTVIVPSLNFTCNGRITNIRVRILNDSATGNNFPYIQVWRPSSSSQLYSLTDQVQIQSSHLNTQLTYLEANIPLTGNNRIQFQSGDVIGFYNPPDSGYEIRDITTPGYKLLVFVGASTGSLDLSAAHAISTRQKPLIRFTVGELVTVYVAKCLTLW